MKQKNKECLISSQYELSNYIFNSVKKQHLSQSERDCLLAIANCMNPDNNWTCFPSYDTIADTALVSVRTAKSCVASLKEKGVVTYKQGRSGVANVYSISLQVLVASTGVPARYKTSTKKPVDKPVHQPIQSKHSYELDEDEYENAPF